MRCLDNRKFEAIFMRFRCLKQICKLSHQMKHPTSRHRCAISLYRTTWITSRLRFIVIFVKLFQMFIDIVFE